VVQFQPVKLVQFIPELVVLFDRILHPYLQGFVPHHPCTVHLHHTYKPSEKKKACDDLAGKKTGTNEIPVFEVGAGERIAWSLLFDLKLEFYYL
jgi:hypothetical protein